MKTRVTAPCACGCGREGRILARGLVARCYQRLRRAGRLPLFPASPAGRPTKKETEECSK